MSQAPTNCPWCAHPLPGPVSTCPSCGAPTDRPLDTDDAGWTLMPGARDMAELEVGTARCQISGTYVPVADFQLSAQDTVYFAHHVVLWRDESVDVRVRSMKGAWKRMLAGLPLVMAEAQGPGHIAFSRDAPGELIAIPLNPGQQIDVREHVFVAATESVAYDWFQTHVWYTTGSGDEQETHYPLGMFMDRFSAPTTPGLLLLHGVGNLFVRTLKFGETLLVKPNALLYKDPGVSVSLMIDQVNRGFFVARTKYMWIKVHGPGRVAIQSADKHHHEAPGNVTRSSGTLHDW